MAKRPIFIWQNSNNELFCEKDISFYWNPGFSITQKRKNIHALHKRAEELGFSPLLEVSTKSESKLGQRLSAFNLRTPSEAGEIPVECAYQGSKIFEFGGPFTDLYQKSPREAKKDSRLNINGKLIGFQYHDNIWPLRPKTAFYDWLIFQALYSYATYLKRLLNYSGFTDIEFNPEKSVSCQARTCAIIASLIARNEFTQAASDPGDFMNIYEKTFNVTSYRQFQKNLL